jgi:hypothetical protein
VIEIASFCLSTVIYFCVVFRVLFCPPINCLGPAISTVHRSVAGLCQDETSMKVLLAGSSS